MKKQKVKVIFKSGELKDKDCTLLKKTKDWIIIEFPVKMKVFEYFAVRKVKIK